MLQTQLFIVSSKDICNGNSRVEILQNFAVGLVVNIEQVIGVMVMNPELGKGTYQNCYQVSELSLRDFPFVVKVFLKSTTIVVNRYSMLKCEMCKSLCM